MSIVRRIEHYSVVAMAGVFIGIGVTTYRPGRKAKIEQQGRIPLEDEV